MSGTCAVEGFKGSGGSHQFELKAHLEGFEQTVKRKKSQKLDRIHAFINFVMVKLALLLGSGNFLTGLIAFCN